VRGAPGEGAAGGTYIGVEAPGSAAVGVGVEALEGVAVALVALVAEEASVAVVPEDVFDA
jgi:hypothetical protein